MVLQNPVALSDALRKFGWAILAGIVLTLVVGAYGAITAQPSLTGAPQISSSVYIIIAIGGIVLSLIQIQALGEAQNVTIGSSAGEAFGTLKILAIVNLTFSALYTLAIIVAGQLSTFAIVLQFILMFWGIAYYVVSLLKYKTLATQTNVPGFGLLYSSYKLLLWAILTIIVGAILMGVAVAAHSDGFILLAALVMLAACVMIIVAVVKYIKGWFDAAQEVLEIEVRIDE